MCVCVLGRFSHVQLFATLWTVAHQAPLSMGFSRQEYWSGLSFLLLGDLPNQGIKPRSPTLQADSLPTEPPGKPNKLTLLLLSLSRVQLSVTPWTAAQQASLSFTISWSLLRFMSIKLMMPSKHLILCHTPLLLPSIFPASGSLPMSQLFTSDDRSIGASASTSVLPMNVQI